MAYLFELNSLIFLRDKVDVFVVEPPDVWQSVVVIVVPVRMCWSPPQVYEQGGGGRSTIVALYRQGSQVGPSVKSDQRHSVKRQAQVPANTVLHKQFVIGN